MEFKQWGNFKKGNWNQDINVRDFIQLNYIPYEGDDSFLKGPTDRTRALNKRLVNLFKVEKEFGGVLDIDTSTISSLVNYSAGYLDKENELIVGMQTNRPLKRGVNPFGGIRMARSACEAYGYQLSDEIEKNFLYKTTHNDGVYRVYTDEMRKARKTGIITGLPDAYGRGRIIGDYRRVALYGVDVLIKAKQNDKDILGKGEMNQDTIRQSEELYSQIDFLKKLKKMAEIYGYNISAPANNAREAIQWLYFGYLAAIKEQNGAAMSLGRTSTFIDIYIENDIKKGILSEDTAQELVDDFVMKLRMARHLRTPEYNDLFGGDPMWITESIGGMGEDGRTLVSKTSFRYLNTLYNLGASAEPNLTVLWSEELPENFKEFCGKVTIDTDSIQYESDDIMKPTFGDDYAISCCVSPMKVGKQMQFFGARCNLAKLLLYSLNGGMDEKAKIQVGPKMDIMNDKILKYDEVIKRLNYYMEWLAGLYVNTLNIIHYMHDKYAYEKTQMALHDTDVERIMAFGVAGLSVIVDSLSAIKHAKVTPIKDKDGVMVNFDVDGDYPKYGNDDDRVDNIAIKILEKFDKELKKHKLYRNAKHSLSALTITSNVVYGKKTGATPDGRKAGEAFAPGANPMSGRDTEGALASLNSVAKLPYCSCQDGISNTFSVVPGALGNEKEIQTENLVSILDGYFMQGAQHINVNVLDKEKLIKAYEDENAYPNLTIRVSGYAVNFHKLNKEQQKEVINRTFHESM